MSDQYTAGQVLEADELNSSFSGKTDNADAQITGGYAEGLQYLYVVGTTNSTSPNTGALQTAGGLGVAGDAWVGGGIYAVGAITARSTLDSTTLGSGSLVSLGGASVAKTLRVGGSASVAGGVSAANATLSSTTDATSATTGAMTIAGGVGIAKSLYVGGAANVSGALTVAGAVTSSGQVNAAGVKLSQATVLTFADGTTQSTAATTTPTNATFTSVTTTGALSIGGNTLLYGTVAVAKLLTLNGGLIISQDNNSVTGIAGIDVGVAKTTMSYVDLHGNPGNVLNDYDARLTVTGGTAGTVGKGSFSVLAGAIALGAPTSVAGALTATGNIISSGYLVGAGVVAGANGVTLQNSAVITFADGTTQNTAAAGASLNPTFDSVMVDGNVTLAATNATIELQTPDSSSSAYLNFMLDTVYAWKMIAASDRSFSINRYASDGTSQGAALSISNTTGVVTIPASVTSSGYSVDAAAGTYRTFLWNTSGSRRWDFGTDAAAESGNNVGTNLSLSSCDDSGNYLQTFFSFIRSNGSMTLGTGGAIHLNGPTTIGGGASITGSATIDYLSVTDELYANGGLSVVGGIQTDGITSTGSAYFKSPVNFYNNKADNSPTPAALFQNSNSVGGVYIFPQLEQGNYTPNPLWGDAGIMSYSPTQNIFLGVPASSSNGIRVSPNGAYIFGATIGLESRPTFAGNVPWDKGNLVTPVDTGTTATTQAGRTALGQSRTLLSSQTVTLSQALTSIAFDISTTEFDDFEIEMSGMQTTSSSGILLIQFGTSSSSYDSSASYTSLYRYMTQPSASGSVSDSGQCFLGASYFEFMSVYPTSSGTAVATASSCDASVIMRNMKSTTLYKKIAFEYAQVTNGGSLTSGQGHGFYYGALAAINNVKIYLSTAAALSGRFSLYGIKR